MNSCSNDAADVKRPTLREYNANHIDENVEDLEGFHENELFWGCTFRNLRGVTLKDCVLKNSKFITDKLEEVKGFTMTLGDCNSFRDVEFSGFLFDLYLVMAIQSKGNTEKRKKLIEIVGRDRVISILKQFQNLDIR